MAALPITAAEAALATTFATKVKDALLSGTSGGATLTGAYSILADLPSTFVDQLKEVFIAEIQAVLTGTGAKLPSFTVAGLPSAVTAGAGSLVYVSNETGGAVPAFSDGAAWRRVTDRAIVS